LAELQVEIFELCDIVPAWILCDAITMTKSDLIARWTETSRGRSGGRTVSIDEPTRKDIGFRSVADSRRFITFGGSSVKGDARNGLESSVKRLVDRRRFEME
jgi:hypothetical protein